jgi:predicted nucleic acid-binding protein
MSQNKPTIYLDTSILSALHYRGGALQGIARQIRTRDWWDQERHFFELYVSVFTAGELEHGVYGAQQAAVREARRLRFLPVVRGVWEAKRLYIAEGVIPPSFQIDAFQLAVATAHQMDYLLTWNSSHLANLGTQLKLKAINDRMHWRTPWVVSPDSIPRVLLGEAIRRSDE